MKQKIYSVCQFVLVYFLAISCSYEQFNEVTQEFEIPSEVFKSDFNQSWQAILQIMKRYDIAQQNQEAGVIKTRWMDNTREVNFANSFSKSDQIKSARFRFTINVIKGFRAAREVTKVTIFKRQMIEQDFLQGWKEVRSDGILEKTILYRITQLIKIDNKLKEIDLAKEREQLQKF